MDVRKADGLKSPDLKKPEFSVSQKKAAESGDIPAGGDQITLSRGAGEISRLTAAVSDLPDVRTDKVETIRNALESGTYSVRGEMVADKLLKEVIFDAIV
ncbi:MAG: negative regulator of flagellin synthesis FlgM [Nitrospirae bacterium]|nr:MAG: negative regulator of flagellin synthesis FlgM [Nitrospirota bacterium]